MKRKWKWILGIAITGIIAFFIIMNMAKELNVSVVEVQPQTIAKTFTEEGKVAPEKTQPITATNRGKVQQLLVEEGDIVEKGGLLVVIDSSELHYQLEQLKGQLKSLQAEESKAIKEQYSSEINTQKLKVDQALQEVKQAKENLARMEQLYKANAISQTDYEDAKHKLNSVENQLKQQEELLSSFYKTKNESQQIYQGQKEAIEAQIDLVEHQIKKNRLIAPFDGVISNLTVEVGTIVGPEAPVMEIFKKDTYIIETYVLTEDVSHLKKGQKVDIIQDNEGEDIQFQGNIEKIAPSAIEKQSALGLIEQRVKISIKPDMSNKVKLAPGYAFDIKFTTAKQENQLVIPKTTLFPYEKGDAVWVVRDGKAVVQTVKKGFATDQDVAITEGLKKGDLVILNPQLEGLKESKKVVPQ